MTSLPFASLDSCVAPNGVHGLCSGPPRSTGRGVRQSDAARTDRASPRSPTQSAIGRSFLMTIIEHIPVKYQPVRDPGPYEPGRRCAVKECITVLSRNNPGPCCDNHTPDPEPPAVVRARIQQLIQEEQGVFDRLAS